MAPVAWRSILVAVRDPGARRQAAVGKAAHIAAAHGARLTLFHAFSTPYPLPEPMPSTPRAVLRAVARARREQLLELARPLVADGLTVDCVTAWDFPPAHAIVRCVLAGKHDLVVAESHRRSALARWFLANADWDLIRECPCPVWFVKDEQSSRRPLVLVAVDPAHARARPSGLDERLLAVGASVTRHGDGRLVLVHVRDLTSSPVADARAAVARLARRHGVPAKQQVTREGVPAAQLTASAADLGASLLVMGAVSRSAGPSGYLGNTAEAVIDGVACDVLVVKGRGFRSRVPRRRPRLPPA